MIKLKGLFALLLCVVMLAAGCAGQNASASGTPTTLSPASTIEVSGTPTATAKPTPTVAPLPDIGTLVAKYDSASGVVLTWAPFVTKFTCTLERRDDAVVAFADLSAQNTADAVFKTVSTVESESGTFTDAQPGISGAQPVYRLCVSDGSRKAYSDTAECEVPFDFGSTGGNLQNGGLACDKNSVIYRLGIENDEIGIYSIDGAGSAKLMVKSIASQLNAAGGYLYYIKQATGELYRMPLAGGEPKIVCEEKMVFALAIGSRVYGTLDEDDALVMMNGDGTGMETIETDGCYDLGADGQTLYYTNTSSGEFCMRDLVSGETKRIPMAKRGYAQLWNGRVYYQDESNEGKLTCCALDGSDIKVLLDQPVTGLNVTERGVFCVNRGDGDTLYRVALDGSKAQQLTSVTGDYVNVVGEDLLLINAAGRFYQVGEDGTVTKLYG